MTAVAASTAFWAIVRRDLSLARLQGATAFQSAAFFGIVVSLVPFGLGTDLDLLQRVAPGIIWLAFILASLLSVDRLFQADFEDGSLELLILSPLPLELVVLAKCVAHWCANALPLLVIAPVFGLILNLPLRALLAMEITLTLGTPSLVFLGAVGAALTVAVRRAGILIALLVLPLYVPVLIFGVGAVNAAMAPAVEASPVWLVEPNLLLLVAISLIGVSAGLFAAAAALRLHYQ